jgi:hypothetical protein
MREYPGAERSATGSIDASGTAVAIPAKARTISRAADQIATNATDHGSWIFTHPGNLKHGMAR